MYNNRTQYIYTVQANTLSQLIHTNTQLYTQILLLNISSISFIKSPALVRMTNIPFMKFVQVRRAFETEIKYKECTNNKQQIVK